MATETFYNESGTSPPAVTGYKLGFTPWAQPLMAVTDDYEAIVLGFKRSKFNGISYVAVDGRIVPAEGTALFALGGHQRGVCTLNSPGTTASITPCS